MNMSYIVRTLCVLLIVVMLVSETEALWRVDRRRSKTVDKRPVDGDMKDTDIEREIKDLVLKFESEKKEFKKVEEWFDDKA
ncbi:hypothetical protein ACF0H5_019400 [Mactra antiquata]